MSFRLDPRTKLVLLLLCTLSATMSPFLVYGVGLVLLVSLLGVLCGRVRLALLGMGGYLLLYLLSSAALAMNHGTLKIMLIASFSLFHKVYPCGLLSALLISTTKVGEFLSAMNRMHAPKMMSISMAVMLRYLPAIREDWRFIKDAMRQRDVAPSLAGLLTRPAMTIECLYVPLMMSASKAADELSIASVTRGIENPKPRTSLVQIRFGLADVLAVLCFLSYFVAGQLL